MNIFENYLSIIIKSVEKNKKTLRIKKTNNFKGVTSESPPSNFDYDLSTNIALILGKVNNLNPKDLCKNIKEFLIKETKDFSKIDVAGPGFLNIKFTNETLKKIILNIIKENNKYGSSNQKDNYNIEFVSANPTGPMHVGHCRGAIFGDVLSNLLSFNGNKVTKEYYINDYGNQIINFTKSVFLRIREIKFKEPYVDHKNLYPGQYIIDIAKEIIKENPDLKFENFDNSYEMLSKKALDRSMRLIKDDLNKLGIKHDYFFSEKDLVKKKLVEKSIENLKRKKFVVEGYLKPPKGEESKDWKKTKRLIFKSSIFGDDSDRALQKNDGSWTYFANDVAYHSDKISRKYNYLINILGADHTGYTKRISAAVDAMSKGKTKLTCKVCQLVKLYKKGKPFKMSKRSGEFISVGDLLKEVDKDSIRFMMLNRSNDVELDFDFDKVLEKSKDNPVFYVQYCYARICSLFRSIKLNEKDSTKFEDKSFNLNQFENKILRKIYDWPKIVETSVHKLEPHRIPFYLYDLATLFHSYWSKGNENDDFKFVLNGRPKNLNTIAIIKLIFIVLQNGMKILNVSLPKKM